jgi:nitrogen fixation protein FixH
MKAQIFWIGFVVCMLLMSVVIYGTALIISLTDPTFAVEPDYEQKAANWDQHRAQVATNNRLGWMADLTTTAADEPEHVDVSLALFDKWGKPINGASVEVETFYNARASRRIHDTLEQVGEGAYEKRMELSPSGVWEFRLVVKRKDDTFTKTIRKSILSVPRGRP